MNYLLIIIYLAISAGLCCLGFSGRPLSLGAGATADDRRYWNDMLKKLKKGAFIGAGGGLLTAIAIALKLPLPAEVGCITLLSAAVFTLAMLCRKTDFRPCEETLRYQKKYKLLLLVASFGALYLTQLVFQYFI